MLLHLLDGPALRTAQSALSALSRRQEAIAANIANIDTPGYQRRDVSFEDTLRAQLAGGAAEGRDLALSRTNVRHLVFGGGERAGGPAMGNVNGNVNGSATGNANGDTGGVPRDVVSMRNDGNTVGIDEEMTRLVETQLRYQALSQSLGSRLATLRTVIRGQ